MADGFLKDIDKLYQICCQLLGKKITIRKTIKTKLKKMYFMNIYLVRIHKYTLKKTAANVILSCLLPFRSKVL